VRRPGQLAFVSQSGALVTAMLDWARGRGIGFSHFVSLGEQADVDFGDMLDWLASDPHTRAILLYIESVEAPRKFMSAARAAARNKPVLVVKAGRSAHGQQAAASHTGALAGADIVFDAAIRRAGMLRVDTLQDLFIAAETLAHFRGRPDATRLKRLTLLTNGGGAGVMAADAAAQPGWSWRRCRRRCAGWTPGCRPTGRAATRWTSSATHRSSAMCTP
jgi:acetyltransferase